MSHDQNQFPGQNPYAKPVMITSGLLAVIFTFFVFPFAYLSVEGITSFASAHYSWLPTGLVSFVWGVIVATVLLSLSMLLFILGLNVALKFFGQFFR